MFGVQEWRTAVQFNIGVVTLVFNNNAYGNVRRDQRERFDGRVVASDLSIRIFVKLANCLWRCRCARHLTRDISRRRWKKRWRRRALPHRHRSAKDSETSPWTFIHPSEAVVAPHGEEALLRRLEP